MTAASHFQLERSVQLTGALVAETPIHIGSGRSIGPASSDAPVLRGADGLPYVPGSSLRGVLRSGIEGLLRAVDDRPRGLWACDPFGEPCLGESLHRETDGARRAALYDESACGACRVFGVSGFASRLHVADLQLAAGGATSVRDGVGIDRDLRTARSGVKFDYELLAPGSELSLSLRASNLADWELGLVASGLQLLDQGVLRVGGMAARGLGLVRTRLEQVVTQDARALLAGEAAEAVDAAVQIGAWKQALQGRLDAEES
jgi:CRISPR-associated RAMP protein (TIGR02581 family)